MNWQEVEKGIFIMITKIKFIGLLLAATFASYSSVANSYNKQCNDVSAHQLAKTLDELIVQSEFIGLYRSNGIYDSPLPAGNSQKSPLFLNRLELSKQLFGNAPEVFEAISTYEVLQIPSDYFYIKDIHSGMVENNQLGLGFAVQTWDSDGNCAYASSFITGYEYLVFGGANSPAVYQPILNRKYDPLYTETVKRIRAKKKAAQSPKK